MNEPDDRDAREGSEAEPAAPEPAGRGPQVPAKAGAGGPIGGEKGTPAEGTSAGDAGGGAESEALDRGLAYGFGQPSAPDESVIDTLARRSGVRPRVLLDDLGSDPSPVLRVGPPGDEEMMEDDPRYQVLGEIARGGVGVVFKSHDRDLGRDVAVKVLRKGLAGMPEIVQRFIEEAQIGGQLQHPGIVPVYGLGLQRDGRPFFAMKLIKGLTLAALIHERHAAGEDRRRLMGVFERVCQTVAYAHSRGVVHRDLKPSNVLVGAFGEVQVVDWGFAKVLARGGNADERRPPDASIIQTVRSGSGPDSASRVGSIMGTPAYMPPEQARGDVERLDERADVFSLGAILTEILTGEPPYVGESLVAQAAMAQLDGAMERLDASGADPALVALAKRCLTPAREARPRNAGEVAEAVTGHLASLEQKAREAELRAAAAHRTRRLTIGLAAAILLAVVGVGGGIWRADRAEREREASASETVAAALADASVLLGRARQADVSDPAPWAPAVAAAERAVALGAKIDAPADVRGRAGALLAEVTADQVSARTKAARAEAERRLAERLRRVRELRWIPRDHKEEDAAYEATFKEVGVDLAQPEAAAAAVREHDAATGLIVALDDWRRLRIGLERDPAPVERVLALADPDATRVRIREAERKKDLDALRAMVPAAGPGALPPQTLPLLAWALGNAGDPAAALRLIRVWQESAPYEHDRNLALGLWLSGQKPLQVTHIQEAVAAYTRAAAIDREGAAERALLAGTQAALRLFDAAIATVREAIALAPGEKLLSQWLARYLSERGQIFEKAGEDGAAAGAYREAIALLEANRVEGDGPGLAALYTALGGTALRLKDWAEVRSANEHALALKPDLPAAIKEHLALALLHCGLSEEGLKKIEEVLASGHKCGPAHDVHAQLLASLGRLEEAVGEFRAASTLVPAGTPNAEASRYYTGLVLLRLGRAQEAAEAFREAIRIAPKQSDQRLLLAQALRHAGDAAGAREAEVEAARLQLETAKGAKRKTQTGLTEINRWGRFLGLTAQPSDARAALVAAFPDPSPEERAAFLAGLVLTLLNNRLEVEAAEACVKEALDADPRCGDAWEMVGWMRFYRLDYVGALEAMKTAGECRGGERAAHNQLMNVYLTAGRFEEAASVLDTCESCKATAEEIRKFRGVEGKIPAFLRGEWKPEGEELQTLTDVLLLTGRAAPLGPLVEGMLAKGPPPEARSEWSKIDWRLRTLERGFNGAAALAGDATLSPEERSRWRRQGAAWLEEYARGLVDRDRFLLLFGLDARLPEFVARWLTPRLASLRDEKALADAPAEDREACRKAWAALRAYHEAAR